MYPSQRYRLHSHLPEVPRLDQRHWEEAWRKYEAAVVPTTKKTEADEDGAADAKAQENEPEENYTKYWGRRSSRWLVRWLRLGKG